VFHPRGAQAAAEPARQHCGQFLADPAYMVVT
jgi:hypothetical protein